MLKAVAESTRSFMYHLGTKINMTTTKPKFYKTVYPHELTMLNLFT